jgi:hypothetical protein
MTDTPTFNDITPPDELVREWAIGQCVSPEMLWRFIAINAARWGARHGYEQARQLWPEPICDRPPTEADRDDTGNVGVWIDGWYVIRAVEDVCGRPWFHTPRWQPRQPSLKEQALEDVDFLVERSIGGDLVERLNRIRRALEQAREGQAHE